MNAIVVFNFGGFSCGISVNLDNFFGFTSGKVEIGSGEDGNENYSV